jgi:hypothetical protein
MGQNQRNTSHFFVCVYEHSYLFKINKLQIETNNRYYVNSFLGVATFF